MGRGLWDEQRDKVSLPWSHSDLDGPGRLHAERQGKSGQQASPCHNAAGIGW